jgi:hypothetical protein
MTPLWFDYLVVIGCSAVLSFGGFGLLLAVLGHFSTVPVFLLGAAGTVVCTVLGRPEPNRTTRAPARVTLPALGMCFVALSVTIWNSLYASHHVEVSSDPGVYASAGRWLASHSSLIVPHTTAPWSSKGIATNTVPAGMYLRPNGNLQFQFAHLLPALLGEAHRLGGDALMFRVPPVLNAIALCAIYATGCRLIRRPWLVLAAVTALALSLPQLYFSRDTYSEPATQVLLWGGIWLLLRAYESRRVAVGLLAGLAIGGTLMTRIDAVAYLIPLPLLAAAGWLAARSAEDRRSLIRVYAAVIVGVVPTAVLGTIDVQRRAGTYYHDLRHSVRDLYLLVGLSLVVAVVIVLLWASYPRARDWVQTQRNRISVVVAWTIAIVFVAGWFLRPAGPTKLINQANPAAWISYLQKNQGLPVHPETYAEQTLQWISWYLGPITLALAIAGLCILAVLSIRRGSPAAVTVLLMAGPVTVLYLWNPSINPYQIWAMRRYVPASLPLLILAAAVAIDYAASVSTRLFRGSAWPRRILAAGAVGMIAFPLGVTLPVGKFRVQANYLPLIERTCKTVGPDAAVLFPKGDFDGVVLMQTVRDWCGVPVAQLTATASTQQLESAAAAFRSQGKTLWLIGSGSLVQQLEPASTPTVIGSAISPRELGNVLDGPADHYAPMGLAISGVEVPQGA